MLPSGLDVDLESGQESVARPNDQLAVVSELFFCLRIDEDDFPSFIDDDHRVWRRLKQLTEGVEDFSSLHSKLGMPRHGTHISPLYQRDLVSADASEAAAILLPPEVRMRHNAAGKISGHRGVPVPKRSSRTTQFSQRIVTLKVSIVRCGKSLPRHFVP